jgi:uncharacterized protein involved in response to NO
MKRLLDAPHRIFFFAAAVQIVIVSAWWAASLLARAAGLALPASLEPAAMHALLMIYGFFPLFIYGFLYTAGPRWLDHSPLERSQYAVPAIAAASAAWLLLPALLLGAQVAAAVVFACILAWSWLLARFVMLIVASRVGDRVHVILIAAALALGILGLVAARLWLVTGQERWQQAMQVVGLWGFLVPLFASVAHRMIPFFTANVAPYVAPWRPAWTLAILLGASLAHGALALAGLAAWTWVADAPAGAMAAYLAWRWGFARSLSNRMLAMLHLGFAWMAAAWVLNAAQSAAALAGEAVLGLAPVHALSIGFLASLTLAMVSRVSCGHSGRRVTADRLTWIVFLCLQAAAATRVAADIFTGAYAGLLAAAALLWLGCFGAWTWRYLPYYWSPRADGKPG